MGRAEAERLRQPFVSRHRREPGPADDDLAVGRDDASPRLDVKRRRRALGRELVLERERRLRVEGPYERTSGWS